MPSKESLQTKLDTFKSQLLQLQANSNALQGAIQMLEQLIAEEDTPAAVVEKKKKDKKWQEKMVQFQ
jgi:phage shock protein A